MESRHGGAGGGALLPHSPRRTFLESPQRTEEVKPHFASTQMSATTICQRICSKSQWPPREVRLGEGRDGNGWVEDFQASEFCPPSVRGHENMKQLCGKKLVSGYCFHVPRKLIRFQEKGGGNEPHLQPPKGIRRPPGPILPDRELRSWSPASGDPAHHPSCPSPSAPSTPSPCG